VVLIVHAQRSHPLEDTKITESRLRVYIFSSLFYKTFTNPINHLLPFGNNQY